MHNIYLEFTIFQILDKIQTPAQGFRINGVSVQFIKCLFYSKEMLEREKWKKMMINEI